MLGKKDLIHPMTQSHRMNGGMLSRKTAIININTSSIDIFRTVNC